MRRTRKGGIPLSLAAFGGWTETAALLLDHGGDATTALLMTTAYGPVETAALLLDRGADVNAIGSEGGTPLLSAVSGGNIGIAALLLDPGAAVNTQDPDGITPLLLAAYHGRTEMAALMLDHGAQVNVQGPGGTAPLYLAVGNDHTETAALLRARGARPSAPGVTYCGGDGSSPDEAIVIDGVADNGAGIEAEYLWLRQQFGPLDQCQQALLELSGQRFDRMEIRTEDGTEHTVYFNISSFFGR